jgi:hypothetical protein
VYGGGRGGRERKKSRESERQSPEVPGQVRSSAVAAATPRVTAKALRRSSIHHAG